MLQRFILLNKIIICLLISSTLKAQIKNANQISCIGNTGSINPVFAGSFVIDSKACFVMASGLQTLQINKSGIFSSVCKVLYYDDFLIKLVAYPNPIINTVILKTVEHITLLDNPDFHLEVYDALGRLLQSHITAIGILNAGYEMDFRQFSNGIYFIKVMAGSTNIQLIKVVK